MSIRGEFDCAEDGVDSIEGGATVEAEDVGHFGEDTNLEEIVLRRDLKRMGRRIGKKRMTMRESQGTIYTENKKIK